MAATPRDLVKCISKALGVPISTVTNIDRKLMEAGLRTKKAHGRGSAIMTYLDASMDTVAVAATADEITRAPECTAKARALPFVKDYKSELAELCAIIGGNSREYKTFGAAMDGIMRHFARTRDEARAISFDIVIAAGEPLLAAIFVGKGDGDALTVEFFHPGALAKLVETGMTVRRVVTDEALQTIATCVSERSPPTDRAD
jgi:hypothetical protein